VKFIVLAVAFVLACSWSPRSEAFEVRSLETSSGTTLEFAIVTPEGFERNRDWPILLALPGGAQDIAAVSSGLRNYWGDAAAVRGWVVVAPVAPAGVAFHEGSADLIPELLDALEAQLGVEGGRFHLTGFGVGGLSAFSVAIGAPERFASLVVFPGGPANANDVSRLDRLTGLRVRMFAGGLDEDYVRLMDGTAKQLKRLGVDVQALTLNGEGTPPESIGPDVLFEVLEQVRTGMASDQSAGAAGFSSPDTLLDGLKDAAARGNGKEFFACFTEDAVVFWLDPASRWSRDDLAQRLRPLFGTGERLRFTASEREISPLPGGTAVVFDETLTSLELGRCRAQGVLLETGEGWRIFRYGLDCVPQLVLPRRTQPSEPAQPE